MGECVTGPRHAESVTGHFLKISIDHLTPETCENLYDYEGLRAVEAEGGWLMSVSTSAEKDAVEFGWPSELAPIMALAARHNCTFVLFHMDHEHASSLPAFPS